jgi:hypothetical protein
MDRRRRWTTTTLLVIATLAFGSGVPVSAQTPKEVTESLCKLFTRKQVRSAFGMQVGSSDQVAGSCFWGLVDRGDYGGSDLQLQLSWDPARFDDLHLIHADAAELDVAGRRALFWVEDGQVVVPGEGQVVRPIDSTLILDLDAGPLTLQLVDTKGKDRQSLLTGLGELAVAGAAGLTAPAPVDPAIIALVPPTIGGDPTVIRRVLFPGQEFCTKCAEYGAALRSALEAQGKTMADVSMLSASTVALAGANSSAPPVIRALRVPDADAAAFVEPMIGYLFGGTGVTPERTEGTGVVAVTRRGDQYNAEWTAVLYANEDILWVVTAPEALRTEVLAALPGAPVPPPIPTPAPTPTPDVSTPEGYLRSLMPASIGGQPLRVQSGGAGWIATFDRKTAKWAQTELKKSGKTLEDLSSMVGFDGGGTNIIAMRVPDVDVTPLVDLIVGSYRSMGAIGKKTKAQPIEIVGRSAFSLKAQGQTVYMYPKDDVLWMVQVPDEGTLQEVFAALP